MTDFIISDEKLDVITQRRGMSYLSCQGRFRDDMVLDIKTNHPLEAELKKERERIVKWLEDNWQFFEIEDPDDSQHAQIDGYDMLIESLRSSD
jgi:hypothetical protein